MQEILLGLVAFGLFVVAYAIFALRATLYYVKEELRKGLAELQKSLYTTAYSVTEIVNVLNRMEEEKTDLTEK